MADNVHSGISWRLINKNGTFLSFRHPSIFTLNSFAVHITCAHKLRVSVMVKVSLVI